MDEKVTWLKDGTHFAGTASSLNGASIKVGGEGNLKPTELVMLGLAGCTAMDVISILEKKQEVVKDFEVSVESTRRADHPKSFTGATVHYKVTGSNINPANVARAVELSATKYCTVSTTLEKAMPIEFVWSIVDEAGNVVSEGKLAQ